MRRAFRKDLGLTSSDGKIDVWDGAPSAWRHDAEAQLQPGETPLAWFEPDLDERMRFASSFIVLTDRRVLAAERGADSESAISWRSWTVEEVAHIRSAEHAGLGTLELLGAEARLA